MTRKGWEVATASAFFLSKRFAVTNASEIDTTKQQLMKNALAFWFSNNLEIITAGANYTRKVLEVVIARGEVVYQRILQAL